MGNFYIEYENSSGSQYQEFSTGALLMQFIDNNKTTFINHCKVVAKLPEITTMSWMFEECSSITSIDLSNFDTSNVTDMSWMFGVCSSITSIDLSNFDTSNVTSMGGMFAYCSSITSIDLSNFNTSNVTDMSSMFAYCSSLTSIDLSNFDTSNVTDMSWMFEECSSLTTLYCNDDWSEGVVSYSNNMFSGCASLVGAISFDSSKVDVAYANPTTGYFTVKSNQIGKILFNTEEFKKVIFDGVEYNKIIFENEVLWSKNG